MTKILLIPAFLCITVGCNITKTPPTSLGQPQETESPAILQATRVSPELNVLADGTVVPRKGKGMSKKDFNHYIAGHGWEIVEEREVKADGRVELPDKDAEGPDRPRVVGSRREQGMYYFSADSVTVFESLIPRTFHWKVPIAWDTKWNTAGWTWMRREVCIAEDKENPMRFITTRYMTILSYDAERKEMVALSRKHFKREGGVSVPLTEDKLYGYTIAWLHRMTDDELKENLHIYQQSRAEYERERYGI